MPTIARSAALTTLPVAFLLAAAPSASAVELTTTQQATTSTRLAKLGSTVTFPATTMTSTIDTDDGSMTSTMPAQTTTTRLALAGLPLADVRLRIVPDGPAVGSMSPTEGWIRTTQRLNVEIESIRPVIAPGINLVKPTCKTTSAGSVALSGDFTGITEPATLTGDLTIPSFSGCGFGRDLLVTAAVSGPGNKVTVDLSPAGT